MFVSDCADQSFPLAAHCRPWDQQLSIIVSHRSQIGLCGLTLTVCPGLFVVTEA